MQKSFKESFISLKFYCESQDFMGWDPYDGLNSKVFQATPMKNWYLARLIWIQSFKVSPINFRKLLNVTKDHNAKGIGLFLAGYCNIYMTQQTSGCKEFGSQEDILKKIYYLTDLLLNLQTNGYSGSCWGYNFDWQARAFFLPQNTPTVVATAFIGCALIDAYEITGDKELLKTARSACDFILNDLNRNYDENGNFAFSYSPLDHRIVYNASLLGSRLLSKVYGITHEDELIENARKSVKFCCDQQRTDGSWGYGALDYHQWVDNFHTGYNLECIAEYIRFSGDNTFKLHLSKGFEYYINNFFTKEGMSRYYNNSTFPIDIHAPAQMIITFSKLGKFNEHNELIERVINWTINNMQTQKGFFYFQINKYFSSKIPYMRWAQAWMFYSLSEYMLNTKKTEG